MYGCGDSPSVRHLIFKPYQVREKKPNHSCIFNLLNIPRAKWQKGKSGPNQKSLITCKDMQAHLFSKFKQMDWNLVWSNISRLMFGRRVIIIIITITS